MITFSVKILSQPKRGTPRARLGEQDAFMKIAPFPYQLNYLKQEVTMYQHLLRENPPCAPKLLGYVYEETSDRVVGLLCQAIEGRHPVAADHGACLRRSRTTSCEGRLPRRRQQVQHAHHPWG